MVGRLPGIGTRARAEASKTLHTQTRARATSTQIRHKINVKDVRMPLIFHILGLGLKEYDKEIINNLSGGINNYRIETCSGVLYGPDEGQEQRTWEGKTLRLPGTYNYFRGGFGWGLRGSCFVS